MTEERKEELRQLLQKAMENLEIRLRSEDKAQLHCSIDTDQYKEHLQQRWASYPFTINSSSIVWNYEFHIANETKPKLLNFIRAEFAPFIHNDMIQSASSFIEHNNGNSSYPVNSFLNQLLKIAIVHGIEKAISDFGRYDEGAPGSFEFIALLEGIRLETEIQVFEGMRLVPIPGAISELPNYLSGFSILGLTPHLFLENALLIIDSSVSPVFRKPFPELSQMEFQVEVTGSTFPNFKVDDFYRKFCQALSLVCNYPFRIPLRWCNLAEDELFNLGTPRVCGIFVEGYFAAPVPFRDGGYGIREIQIDEAKRLYEKLINPNSSIAEGLQIPISRWIQSKTSQTPVDKIIDLGIAFEALYLSETDYNREIRFRFSLHAAWYLGKDKAHREELMKEFKAIYDWRSVVVHTGKLPKKGSGKKKKSYTYEEVWEFIRNAQDLCRDSIMKILKDGEFPDWNNLILG